LALYTVMMPSGWFSTTPRTLGWVVLDLKDSDWYVLARHGWTANDFPFSGRVGRGTDGNSTVHDSDMRSWFSRSREQRDFRAGWR